MPAIISRWQLAIMVNQAEYVFEPFFVPLRDLRVFVVRLKD